MTPQEAFTNATWSWIDKRLMPLYNGNPAEANPKRQIPFLLSKDFAKHFEAIARDVIMPEFLARGGVILTNAEGKEDNDMRQYFIDVYEDQKQRPFLWQMWQHAWAETMVEKTVPPKPKPEEKGFKLKKLFKTDKPTLGPKPLTEEQWQKRAAVVKAHNKKVKMNWQRLMEPQGNYIPPSMDDSALLRNLFGMSAQGLSKNISAIRQIIEQGNNVGRTFDTFQNKKDVDLPLMAVCYKMPDPLIEGEGLLKTLMLAHSKADYPLTARFFPDFFKK